MSSCYQNIQLTCALCRIIFCSACRRKNSKRPMDSFDVICIGLTGAGKTTLLCLLSKQTTDDIVPTTGFLIKACQVDECILNIKEIGGGSGMCQYWKHYYKAAQAVVFVLDSAGNDEELLRAKAALAGALKHPDLMEVPCLIIANCQDKPGAKNTEQLRQIFQLDDICTGRKWSICTCSKDDFEGVGAAFSDLVSLLRPPANVI